MRPRPLMLDVDTGVDDALAIILALRSPEFELLGICTVSGNVDLTKATANTLTVLDVLEAPRIPVAAGAGVPLARPGITAGDVHGGDGLGGAAGRFPASSRHVDTDAAGFLLDTIRRMPGELTLVATGPLTNVAQAIQRDVATMRRLRALTVMGGAIRVPGTVGPVSEFNCTADPEAAAVVLGAGLPLTLVPLDVTERVALTRQAVDAAALPKAPWPTCGGGATLSPPPRCASRWTRIDFSASSRSGCCTERRRGHESRGEGRASDLRTD